MAGSPVIPPLSLGAVTSPERDDPYVATLIPHPPSSTKTQSNRRTIAHLQRTQLEALSRSEPAVPQTHTTTSTSTSVTATTSAGDTPYQRNGVNGPARASPRPVPHTDRSAGSPKTVTPNEPLSERSANSDRSQSRPRRRRRPSVFELNTDRDELEAPWKANKKELKAMGKRTTEASMELKSKLARLNSQMRIESPRTKRRTSSIRYRTQDEIARRRARANALTGLTVEMYNAHPRYSEYIQHIYALCMRVSQRLVEYYMSERRRFLAYTRTSIPLFLSAEEIVNSQDEWVRGTLLGFISERDFVSLKSLQYMVGFIQNYRREGGMPTLDVAVTHFPTSTHYATLQAAVKDHPDTELLTELLLTERPPKPDPLILYFPHDHILTF